MRLRASTLVRYVGVHGIRIDFAYLGGHLIEHLSNAYLLQFVYCGKQATLHIGNVKPIGTMPEGTIVCNLEEVRRAPDKDMDSGIETWVQARPAVYAEAITMAMAVCRTRHSGITPPAAPL